MDAHLLRHLALGDKKRARTWPVMALLLGWVIATIAMAGPTWQKLPTPTLGRLDPTVVVLSLAQSMNATDQSPSRLGAARHKVEDILKRMRGGEVGLVIFADRPFVASPLTEDGRVVGQMLPELATDLMPVLDNRPDIAIAQAVQLLKGADAPAGRIVLITDGPGDAPDFTAQAASAAARAGYEVSVIGVGTDAGTTLRIFDGTPLRGRDGGELRTKMDRTGLERVAAAGGGVFTPATADGRDLDRVFAGSGIAGRGLLENSGLTADQWADMGPYLLLALLVLAPLAFRRGWIAVLLLAALPALSPHPAAADDLLSAETWRNLWQRPDQQGAAAFEQKDFKAAGAHFEDPAWQASALYKSGDYQAAADAFARIPGSDYNRGNALAHAGRLEDAVSAYDAALKADPADKDAAYNRMLVQKLIDQKKKDDEEKKKNKDKDKDQQKDQQGLGQNKPKDGSSNQDQKNDPGQNKPDPKPGDQKPDDQKKDGKSQPDQKPGDQDQPDQKPGDQNKPDQKPGDKDKGGQKPGDQNKPDQKPCDQNKPDQKPGDQAKPDQKPGDKDKAGQDDKTKPEAPSGPDKTDASQPPAPQPKPSADPGAEAGAKPGDQKPAASKPGGDKPEAAKPQPPQPAPQLRKGDGQPPNSPAALAAQRAKAEQDQTKEQMLRMVPDDPAGLLRARIRSHYYVGAPPGLGDQ